MRIKVNANVLRTIDKLGGLDEYLIGSDTPGRIKELGVAGWRLRWEVMQTDSWKERVKKEREQFGLPPEGWQAAERNRLKAAKAKAYAVAEQYNDLVQADRQREKAEKQKAREVDETPEDITSDRISSGDQVEGAAAIHLGSEYDPREPQNAIQYSQSNEGEGLEDGKSTSSPSTAEALAEVEHHARKLDIDVLQLLGRARAHRERRAQQESTDYAAERRRKSRQANFAKAIDQVASTFESENRLRPAIELYEKYRERAIKEVLRHRQAEGLGRLSKTRRKRLRGPPADMPPELWSKLLEVVRRPMHEWEKTEYREQREREKTTAMEARRALKRRRKTSTTDMPAGEVEEAKGEDLGPVRQVNLAPSKESKGSKDDAAGEGKKSIPSLWNRAKSMVGLRG